MERNGGIPNAGLSRLQLALTRVKWALDAADYESGCIITGDNVRISDVRILYDAAHAFASGIVAATAGETQSEAAGLDERSEQSPTGEAGDAPNPSNSGDQS